MSDIVGYFSQHLDYFFYALAAILMLVDLSILGLSGPLIFIGIGSLFTGLFISVGWVSELNIAVALFAVLSIASAAILWRPLKKLQDREVGPETSSDMVGKVLRATMPITATEGRVFYSGVEWLARLDSASTEPVAANSQVIVVAVNGTIMVVRPA